jgi:hypothetical protein
MTFGPSRRLAIISAGIPAGLGAGVLVLAINLAGSEFSFAICLMVFATFLLVTSFAIAVSAFRMDYQKYWLCEIRNKTLWVRCARGKTDEPLFLELQSGDVVAIQPIKLKYSGWKGRREFYRYLDVMLSPTAADGIANFLRDPNTPDSFRQAFSPSVRVYRSTPWMFRHDVLRMDWRGVSPRLKRAADLFSSWTTVRPVRRELETLNDDLPPHSQPIEATKKFS